MNEQVSSPKSVESGGGSNSKFKTLKKKIRNKFRLSRGEDVKTISQAVETLKRSDELLSVPDGGDPEKIKNEFKELKITLESIINQNQVLAEVMKSVDSACPDPFNEPEKFSIYFAQKSSNSLNDDFEDESGPSKAAKPSFESTDVENALLRLQNLRMEEQRGFQIERENFETRLGQLSLLQQEIEFLRKQNSEHEIQIEFLKSQNKSEIEIEIEIEIETLKSQLEKYSSEIENLTSQNHQKEISLNEKFENLTKELETLKESENFEEEEQVKEQFIENDQLKGQLEETLLKLKTLQETLEGQEDKERQFREISEENVRLKIEFDELKRELFETRTQLTDLEKEPISSITLSEEEKPASCDESAFKYVYLSNLVLKFLQFPEQRAELSNIILTTLQADQPHFQKVMNMK